MHLFTYLLTYISHEITVIVTENNTDTPEWLSGYMHGRGISGTG